MTDPVDALYTLPFDEFVGARDRLARELRQAGDREAAADVKQLRKPSRVAWAVNQAVRQEPELLDALLGAGATLRRAQQRALHEGGSGAVRDAVRDQRDAVDTLAEVAVAAMGAPGPSARERIKETLNAGSLDPGVEEQLRAGRLSAELELPDLFGTLEPGARVTPAPRPKKIPPVEEIADAERELERLRSRADELDREAKRAVDAAADAHHDAEEAARRLRELRRH